MAKLPIYTQQYGAQGRKADARDFDGSSDAVGRAMSGMGKALGDLAGTLNAREEKKAQDKAEQIKSQAFIDLTKIYNQKKLAAPADGEGFGEDVDAGVQDYYSTLYSNNDEKVNKYLKQYEAQHRSHFVGTKALPTQAAMYSANVINAEQALADDEINLVRSSPNELPNVIKNSVERLTQVGGLDAATRQELIGQHKSNLYYSAGLGAVDVAVTEAAAKQVYEDLKSAQWRNNIDAKQYSQLLNTAERQIGHARALENAAIAEAKKDEIFNMTWDYVRLMEKKNDGSYQPTDGAEFKERWSYLQEAAPKYLSLISSTEKNRQSNMDIARVMQSLEAGEPMNPFDTDDKRAVEAFYQAFMDRAPQDMPEEDLRKFQINLVKQLNVIPAQVKKQIVTDLNSADPERRIEGARFFSELKNSTPNMDMENRFPAAQVSQAYELLAYSELGFDAQQAHDKQMEARSVPENVRKLRQTEAKDLYTDDSVKNILWDAYDGWGFDPDIPPAMVAQAKTLANLEHQIHGSEEAVKKILPNIMSTSWGKTNVGRDGEWMRYAPEKFYGVFGDARDSAWMNDQLADAVSFDANIVKEFDIVPAEERANVDLIYNPYATAGSSGLPTYFIRLWRKDGTYYTSPKPFAFDPSESPVAKEESAQIRRDYTEAVKEEQQKAEQVKKYKTYKEQYTKGSWPFYNVD